MPLPKDNERVLMGDIAIGRALPYTIVDANGRLLFRKGSVIESERQIEGLVLRGLYRMDPKHEDHDDQLVFGGNSPFSKLAEFMHRLKKFFDVFYMGAEADLAELPGRILKLCTDIQKVVEQDSDAVLGAVHLYHEGVYTINHPVHIAVLCELVGKRQGFSAEDRIPILAAALTANIAILALQEGLHEQKGPLTQDQRDELRRHPARGMEFLRDSGITGAKWLKIVEQHHERLDGSGYPAGLVGSAILKEARLLALADSYHALISAHAYREAFLAQEALKELLVNGTKIIDPDMAQIFIKEIGVPPPGAYVVLANGEVAIVTKRAHDHATAKVNSIIGVDGNHYSRPLYRDTADERYAIKGMCKAPKNTRLNLFTLWGY